VDAASLVEEAGDHLRTVGKFGEQHLDGHPPPDGGMLGEIDHPHAAFADLPLDDVVADVPADHGIPSHATSWRDRSSLPYIAASLQLLLETLGDSFGDAARGVRVGMEVAGKRQILVGRNLHLDVAELLLVEQLAYHPGLASLIGKAGRTIV